MSLLLIYFYGGQMGYKGLSCQLPLGSMGVFSDSGGTEVPPTALIVAKNINYAPGYIEKAPGAWLYNTKGALTAGVVGIQDYWPNYAQQRLLVLTADGKLWKDSGDRQFGNMTPIATGIGNGVLDNRCQMVVGGNESAGNPKLVFIFSNGISQIKVLSGDSNSVSNITLPATDWPTATSDGSTNPTGNYPKLGLIHLGRLWVFAKSVAYASTTTNHQDFQTSANILVNNVGPGDGGDIVGAAIYKGTLLVFKEGDVCYALNSSSTSSSQWYFYKFGDGFGMASYHSACQVMDDLIVQSSTGVLTSYQATQKFGSITQGDIFKNARISKFFRENTDYSGIKWCHSLYYPDKGVAMFTARSTFNTKNDAIIQMDLSDPSMPKYGLWNHYQADAITLRRDPVTNIPRPVYGGQDGNIYIGDYRDRTINGSAYTAEFKTPYIDMRHMDGGLAHKMKHFDFLACTFTPDGNHNLSVDVWIDGKFSETLTFNQTIDSNYLGAFKLGSSTLGVEEEQRIVLPLHGTGRSISFRGYNANANENFKVSLFTIGFRPAGEGPISLGQH